MGLPQLQGQGEGQDGTSADGGGTQGDLCSTRAEEGGHDGTYPSPRAGGGCTTGPPQPQDQGGGHGGTPAASVLEEVTRGDLSSPRAREGWDTMAPPQPPGSDTR